MGKKEPEKKEQGGGKELPGEAPLVTEPLEEIERLKGLLEEKTIEAEENHQRFLRACADLNNYKKRVINEKAQFAEFAHESILKELLPVIDNLERALEHSANEKGFESLKDGVELTLNQMHSALEGFGLKEILAVGEKFDPEIHHCIIHEESDDKEPGTVIKEFQKGYTLKDKLLRPSLVVVAKETENKEKNEGGGGGEWVAGEEN